MVLHTALYRHREQLKHGRSFAIASLELAGASMILLPAFEEDHRRIARQLDEPSRPSR
jgi:hypothetical protein